MHPKDGGMKKIYYGKYQSLADKDNTYCDCKTRLPARVTWTNASSHKEIYYDRRGNNQMTS
eukprot:14287292-Ditylum_brightwellii.AAC.1